MEPMNCTVHVGRRAAMSVGDASLRAFQAIAAKLTGLPLDKVTVHNQLLAAALVAGLM
jgi:hypothetical protein